MPSFLLQTARRVVIKLGTGTLTRGVGELEGGRLADIAGGVHTLRERGKQVVIVSSGAIGLGMGVLGLRKRPADLPTLQACAAIGQTILVNNWQAAFDPFGLTVAQVLLTRDDLTGRRRHVAAKDTLEKLLALGTIPVVNENDTVQTEEITFGDNDALSAYVASMAKAELLLILSTTPGLLDPANDNALVRVVETITPGVEAMAGGTTSATAVGGMASKVEAAKIATASGCGVFITDGTSPGAIDRLLEGTAEGTFFLPAAASLGSKKRWLAFFEKPGGRIRLDARPCTALAEGGGSLLAPGITGHSGDFEAGATIELESPDGTVIARGITRFSSAELAAITGQPNAHVATLHPEKSRHEVVHRDSLAMLR